MTWTGLNRKKKGNDDDQTLPEGIIYPDVVDLDVWVRESNGDEFIQLSFKDSDTGEQVCLMFDRKGFGKLARALWDNRNPSSNT